MKSIVILILLAGAAVAAPVRTPSPAKAVVLADAEMRAKEKSGAVLTLAQIEALIEANKTKEALRALMARQNIEAKGRGNGDKK